MACVETPVPIHASPAKVYTENGNLAYGWGSNMHSLTNIETIENEISQMFFQIVLDKNMNYGNIQERMYEMMIKYHNHPNLSYFKLLIKMLAHTRDIKDGKGLYQVSYYFLENLLKLSFWDDVISRSMYFDIVKKFVHDFVNKNDGNERAYGSWKDMKHYLLHIQNSKDEMYQHIGGKYEIISKHIRHIIVPQLVEDKKAMSVGEHVSLCAKWVPREKSRKHSYIARMIAYEYNQYATPHIRKNSEIYRNYRQLVAKLNKYLDTTQIHMANHTWSNIDFDKVTGLTIHNFKDAFLNHKNICESDRINCKHNFENHIARCMDETASMKGKDIMPHQIVKEFFRIVNMENNSMNNPDTIPEVCDLVENDMKVLQCQYNDMLSNLTMEMAHENLKYYVPCIDVSKSMYVDNKQPLYSAIGLGLICMEMNSFKQGMTFSEHPQWIDINYKKTLGEKLHTINDASWGANTNIMAMFNSFLNMCINYQIPSDEISRYTFLVLSDMQFDRTSHTYENEDVMTSIKKAFGRAGYPEKLPHVIFWNLRQTNNFPLITHEPGVTMVSGNSHQLMKMFLTIRPDQMRDMTTFQLIENTLNKPRYNIV